MTISNKLGKFVLVSALALGMVGATAAMSPQTASAAATSTKAVEPRAGIEILANGKATVDGSAYDGLTLTTGHVTNGVLNFHYTGQAFGAAINHPSSLAVLVPEALQPLFASSDFAEKYVENANFSSGSTHHQYTADEITVSEDGSTLFFKNPNVSFLISEDIDINFTVDLGQAVTDNNIRIADDADSYPFTVVFTDATSLEQLDWSLFPQSQTTTVPLGTTQLDPGYHLFKAPSVRPVSDQDTEVEGVAIPNAEVRVYRGSTQLGTTTADESGFYSITIPKQNADVTLTVVQNAGLGDSQKAQVVVSHAEVGLTTPSITKPVKASDRVIKGTNGAAGNQIFIVRDGKVIGSDYVHSSGSWEVTLNDGVKLSADDAIGAYQQNSAGDKSETAYVGVEAADGIPAPQVTVPVTVGDTFISGTGTTDGNTITIKNLSKGWTVTTKVENSKWGVGISQTLEAYDVLQVTESDGAGTVSAPTTVPVHDV